MSKFERVVGLVEWGRVADGGGVEAAAEGGELAESGGHSKAGWYSGHRRGES
jgi:hypothetical protein